MLGYAEHDQIWTIGFDVCHRSDWILPIDDWYSPFVAKGAPEVHGTRILRRCVGAPLVHIKDKVVGVSLNIPICLLCC